jgi:hypothetical protein
MSHEDEIGEPVPEEQMADLRGVIHKMVGSERANHSAFPGSQVSASPVSALGRKRGACVVASRKCVQVARLMPGGT